MNKKTKAFLESILIIFLFFVSLAAVAVWTDPLSTAPNGNVTVPLNVSSNTQSKEGGAVFGFGRFQGLLIADNNVKVGGRIDVDGGIKVGNGMDERAGGAFPSAILEVASTTQGFLPPRMTMAQRNAIRTPVAGLMIYQTNNLPGIYYYDGVTWVQLAGSKDPSVGPLP